MGCWGKRGEGCIYVKYIFKFISHKSEKRYVSMFCHFQLNSRNFDDIDERQLLLE